MTRLGGHTFDWGSRVYVMGIVNATPDSFSGDGLAHAPLQAVEQGLRMVAEGADILDVGGESTRPGHTPVDEAEEIRRVLPVVSGLARAAGVPISIDTSKSAVAEAALGAGATIVNDVWGLKRDPRMAALAARCDAAVVVMHNQDGTDYRDLLAEVKWSLAASVRIAAEAGIPRERIVVDPGIGFGKTAEQNLEVLRRLEELRELGQPLLVGTSRKGFIGKLLAGAGVVERLNGTAATVAAAVLRGADIVRVHDVRQMVEVVRVAEALR